MPWNEPGGGRDPWSGRGGKEGPPDLDEVVRKMQDKLGGLFGRSGGGGGGGGRAGGSPAVVWLLIGIAALVLLAYECVYIIQPAERGVVLRFGKYAATLEPGPNIRFPPPIERVEKVDIDQIRVVSHKASMLTQDENIVSIELAVQYRLKNVTDYLFNARAPDAAVRQATETSVREVIGASKMDFILTAGRGAIESSTRERIQGILDDYGTGLLVADVNMQPASPPEEVKSAFDDAIKAREDEQRLINEAEAYRNEIIPGAR
ncbi:MAG: FtsH protease activity modulator HflK, partial [Gammaproteobacteria bacterium]|nr:FtsH protease activity modulator HflK [Gammaproteobacteria bacterium]